MVAALAVATLVVRFGTPLAPLLRHRRTGVASIGPNPTATASLRMISLPVDRTKLDDA